jgi:hypothetical protein
VQVNIELSIYLDSLKINLFISFVVLTFNNKNDFVVTQTPTKGESNIITLTDDAKEKITKDQTASETKSKTEEKIIINELYPNPPGSDLENEFIELNRILQFIFSLNKKYWQ